MNNPSDLGDKLKKARSAKGYSQNDVARRLNISRQAVSRWENGFAYPDLDNLKLLSKLYEISLDELLGEEVTNKIRNETANDAKIRVFFSLKYWAILIVLIVTTFTSIVGFIVSIVILIYLLREKKKYRLLILLSIFCVLYNLRYVILIITLYFPSSSTISVEKIM